MKKIIVVVGVLVGVGVLVRRFAPNCGDVDWEQRFAAMPDNAPPKWMFRNISEIRDNTERILALLDGRDDRGSGSPQAAEGTAT
jgi:hypothetical protein